MDSLLVMKEEREKEEQEHCNSPSLPTLPPEILYEILTHVALDDLLRRCRWVCRDWNALTYDSKFKRFHCQRTQSVSGYLIQYLTKNSFHTSFLIRSIASSSSPISLDFMPVKDIMIRASSYHAQGLVCCVSQIDRCLQRYYVCKPVTQQWTTIPNPMTGCYNEKMAIMVKKSNPLYYKIIRFSHCSVDWGLQHCEIFDSKKWAWRMHLEFGKFLYSIHFDSTPEVLLHCSFHWLTFSNEQKQIFAFDIDKENWRLIMLPQSQSSSSLEGEEVEAMNCDLQIEKKLVNCEGHRGWLYTPKLSWMGLWSWMELWVMEDYLKGTWKKQYRLSLEPLSQIVGRYSILAMDTMDTILVKTSKKLIWYNCTNGALTKVKKLENPTSTLVRSVHPFNSDFVPCNLEPKEKEREKRKRIESWI